MPSIDQYLHIATEWAKNNPITVKFFTGFLAYIVLNVIPRVSEPKDKSSFWHAVWESVERLAVLSGDRWLGSWKPLFAAPKEDKPNGPPRG